MSLTFRDVEDNDRGAIEPSRLAGVSIALLRILAFVPPVKRYFLQTTGGLLGRMFACSRNEKYEQSALIALSALDKYRHKERGLFSFMVHHHW